MAERLTRSNSEFGAEATNAMDILGRERRPRVLGRVREYLYLDSKDLLLLTAPDLTDPCPYLYGDGYVDLSVVKTHFGPPGNASPGPDPRAKTDLQAETMLTNCHPPTSTPSDLIV